MKKQLLMLVFALSVAAPVFAQEKPKNEKDMNRIELCKKNYTTLFGGEALTGQGSDPELMNILQKFIFGEVFHIGELDVKTREMITCVTLATMQTLPQLKAHAAAALNVGVTPVELREAIYQCAPFIGFPKTLNAVSTINEVFKEKGIALPLESQETVKEDERFEKGKEIQFPLYGEKMKESLKALPDGMNEDLPRLLTEMCFGDFYTRNGLDVKTRELLSLCVLAALGADRQIESHTRGNIKAGNDKATLVAAMIQCLPYIGFPQTLNAIHIIKDIE
ncbi:carboxymuconolactone decarboxylase family protein [Butyricimonas synergistica]|uniref:carboxymuconolactone decarboxylase family protein n=1 Tax=Butyricimonas synergistica TaxID=544644 RepID=UPI0003A6E13B|nr:carboxymuconolactone decarboxylase family protein [Butyricimonas synergistica]